MYSFDLDPTAPNQQFSTVADGINYEITLNTVGEMLFATVKANDVIVKTSGRCISGQWLIPYMAYAPKGSGNFMFKTRDERYPNYKDFNTTCVLLYYTSEELENL